MSNRPEKPYFWSTSLDCISENFETSATISKEGNALRNFKELQVFKLDHFRFVTRPPSLPDHRPPYQTTN